MHIARQSSPVPQTDFPSRCRTRFMNAWHARIACLGKAAGGFVAQPELRASGRVDRGSQLCAGKFLFAGHLIEAPEASIWNLKFPNSAFEKELHGFAWLDDLAAAGDESARNRARAWTWGWIERFGRGSGLGWTPECAGRRAIRWIDNAAFLLNAHEPALSEEYFRSLAHQTAFLARRWPAAPQGLRRFEALAGLVYAGLELVGMDGPVEAAAAALAQECDSAVDKAGGIPSRNPEELLEIFRLLTRASSSLSQAGRIPPKSLRAAIERIARILRALRHSDGGLARFHGGGRGIDGELDRALAVSGARKQPGEGLAMGFARLSAGPTSLILDAAAPPVGAGRENGHASTLAFELTSGRRPLIVNCGSGVPFGANWIRAGRATASHSALEIRGDSSSRFGRRSLIRPKLKDCLADAPRDVRIKRSADSDGPCLWARHDGYRPAYGLAHERVLELSADGRSLSGADSITAKSNEDRKAFDGAMDKAPLPGIPFCIRFHLHPGADAEIDVTEGIVLITLKSGEIWIFSHDGNAHLTLEPSIYMEIGQLKPRLAKQVILSRRAVAYETSIRWTLAKARKTPTYLRDFEPDDDQTEKEPS